MVETDFLSFAITIGEVLMFGVGFSRPHFDIVKLARLCKPGLPCLAEFGDLQL
jgi:hypothetical protein